jgi:hypothetical protein
VSNHAFEIELANEYALVTIRTVNTDNGTRLEIVSPRLGKSIRLDPVELEALTWQSHDMFSKLLQTPFGPEPEGDA